jgi:hypothetical protein
MNTSELQKALLDEISKELEKGDIPLERIRKLAKEAILLSSRFPNDIPPESMTDLIKLFPEITLSIREPLRNESDKRDKDAADEIRKTLGLRH